jgi:tetratricopeptide (TPR) repeat protein
MDNIWAAWRAAGEFGLGLEIAQAARSFTILHTSSGLVPTLLREIERVVHQLQIRPDNPFVNLALTRTLVYLGPAYARHSPTKFLQVVDEAGTYLNMIENPSDVDRAVYLTFRGMALLSLESHELAVDQLQAATALCHRIDEDAVLYFAPAILAMALIELDQYQQAQHVLEQAQRTAVYFSAFFFRAHLLPLMALIGTGLRRSDDARQYLLEAIDENRRYTQVVSFDLLVLAVGEYLYTLGSLEGALEMVCLYFQPSLVNLYLHRKARNLFA